MLLPEDDFPLHQTTAPLAQTMGGHPNAYDRFFFNAVSEDFYFGIALGLYPNRSVIDAAFSVLENGQQHSVFTSDVLTDRRTSVGPITIEIIEPLRVNRIVIDAPEQGLRADLTYTQMTETIEEPRQTMMDGSRIFMDVTRATQLGTWSGWFESPEGRHELHDNIIGTKDRSWGIRPVGEPLPGAPSTRAPQLCFFWAPLLIEEGGRHVMSFDDSAGRHLHHSGGRLPRVGTGPATAADGELAFRWRAGTRWMEDAEMTIGAESYELTPIGRFHMRGIGYNHPTYGHGKWHGGPVTAGEVLRTDDLNPLDYFNIHVQHIVRVQGSATGIGVVEQLIIGPYAPAGLTGLLDGVPIAIFPPRR